jgi:hypothetical protein
MKRRSPGLNITLKIASKVSKKRSGTSESANPKSRRNALQKLIDSIPAPDRYVQGARNVSVDTATGDSAEKVMVESEVKEEIEEKVKVEKEGRSIKVKVEHED